MKIVFMGTPNYAVPALKMLHETYGVSMVVTQPDKKIGRKQQVEYSPVKQYAISNNIPLFQPEKLKNDYQALIEIKPDLIITAAYGQMVPDAVLNLSVPLNLHGSLLPKYRGGAPVQYAIKNGDKKTGITLMYMASKMDAGDIIAQKEVDISEHDNTETLMEKLSFIARDLLQAHMPAIIAGTNQRIKQDENLVTFAYTIKPEQEILDFNQTSDEIINHLRSLLPTPGGSIFIKNSRIKVYEIEKSDIISHEEPGTILKTKKVLLVKTKDGVLSLIKIQPENKKIMMARDFLNGQKLLFEGDKFNQ